MKKLSIYLMLVIAGWSLTACDESFDDYAQPVVYPQGEVYNMSDITGFEATPTAAASSNINLGTMAEDSIQLFTLKMGTLPEGMTFDSLRFEAWPADKGENIATKAKVAANGMIAKEDLAKLVYTFYGKKVTERVFKAKLLGNAFKGKEAFLIKLGEFNLKITPEELESAFYYVFGKINSASALTANKAIMTPDPDPSKDQTFSYTSMFASSSDIVVWNQKYWSAATSNGTKNAKASDYAKVYGMPSVEAATEKPTKGNTFQGLPDGASSPVFFVAPTKAYYTFTIDLEAQTFTWTLLEDQNPPEYSTMTIKGLAADVTLSAVGTGGKTGISKKHNWYAGNVIVPSNTLVTFNSGATSWGYGDADGEWTVDDDVNWAKRCTINAKGIMLPAGKYNVYFCDITGAAHFVPTE